jgi:hypothetical protein
MEADLGMFKLMPKSQWPEEIKSWDPVGVGMSHFVITSALSKAGLIE